MRTIESIKKELGKAIVGQQELIDGILVALLSRGHILVEGVPGIAKTTAVKALAATLGFEFKRVQFTPDLLPADITGSEVLDLGSNSFVIKQGPVFTNLLLADEINRAGAKVQSALLEAMAERQVTIGDGSYPLPSPFMVLATANPVEQEGTYSLPEASLDRFMMKINVGYTSPEEEVEIVLRSTQNTLRSVQQVCEPKQFEQMASDTESIHIDRELTRYIVQIISATRDPGKYEIGGLSDAIVLGASPRGSIDLQKAAKAAAYMEGRDFVTPADVTRSAYGVLRHRIVLGYKALSEGWSADRLIQTILETLPAP
jgi:MoxR-like ATPase